MPVDLWGTLVAAQRLVHLNLGGLYTQAHRADHVPGRSADPRSGGGSRRRGSSVANPTGSADTQPAVWLVAGPYMIALSAMALFAADALAERLRVGRPKRALLAVASAVALVNVSVAWATRRTPLQWGCCCMPLGDVRCAAVPGRVADRGGDRGAPLVLLALPVILAVSSRSGWPVFWPGRPPPPRCCSAPPLRRTGAPPTVRRPASRTGRSSTSNPVDDPLPRIWRAGRSRPGRQEPLLSWPPAGVR